MTEKRIRLDGWACKCERCGHEWKSIGDAPPIRCAACKSPYWRTAPLAKALRVTAGGTQGGGGKVRKRATGTLDS